MDRERAYRYLAKQFMADPTNEHAKKDIISRLSMANEASSEAAATVAEELLTNKLISDDEYNAIVASILTNSEVKLVDVLKEQSRHQAYEALPWTREYDQFVLQLKAGEKVTPEQCRIFYVAAAKNHLLTPPDALYGGYVFFGETDHLRQWANVLKCCSTYEQRVLQHNWYIMHLAAQHFRNTYGPYIKLLMVPLFPHSFPHAPPELEDLNIAILNEAMEHQRRHPQGGRPRIIPSKYFASGNAEVITGAGVYLPAVQMSDGSYGVDVEAIQQRALASDQRVGANEQGLNELQRRVTAIEAANNASSYNPAYTPAPQQATRRHRPSTYIDRRGNTTSRGRGRGGGDAYGRANSQRRDPTGRGTDPHTSAEAPHCTEHPAKDGGF